MAARRLLLGLIPIALEPPGPRAAHLVVFARLVPALAALHPPLDDAPFLERVDLDDAVDRHLVRDHALGRHAAARVARRPKGLCRLHRDEGALKLAHRLEAGHDARRQATRRRILAEHEHLLLLCLKGLAANAANNDSGHVGKLDRPTVFRIIVLDARSNYFFRNRALAVRLWKHFNGRADIVLFAMLHAIFRVQVSVLIVTVATH